MVTVRVFFMTLLVFFLSYLTSHAVVSHSIVRFLPGFDGPLPFTLKTGYIGVDEGEEVQLFYYFIESENNPKEDPILFWLTGGPRCSTVYAILYEIGPFQFEEVKYNGSLPKLILRDYSWTKAASIIFVDLPVGSGFSYAKTPRANHSGDFRSSSNANEFLRKWIINYPEFRSNSIFLGGDSYSGSTIPLFYQQMLDGNEEGMEPFLNLQGYLLGNPSTDRSIDHNHIIPFAHGMGLISDEFYETLQKSCGGEYHRIDPSNIQCKKLFKAFDAGIQGIEATMILEEFCEYDTPRGYEFFGSSRRNAIEYTDSILKQLGAFSCRKRGYALSQYWMNDWSVQDALHVRKESIGEWRRCNFEMDYSFDIKSSIMYHAKLSAKGIRSLIYSGDHDMVVPYSGTQTWIRSLNYSIVEDWRRWWVDGQIAGFTRTYSNKMTFATVKGGGHTAPEQKPKECDAMFKRWILQKPL